MPGGFPQKKEDRSGLAGPGEYIWFGTYQTPAGVHGGARTDRVHAGSGKRHLYRFGDEGEDWQGPDRRGGVSEGSKTGLSTQPHPL